MNLKEAFELNEAKGKMDFGVMDYFYSADQSYHGLFSKEWTSKSTNNQDAVAKVSKRIEKHPLFNDLKAGVIKANKSYKDDSDATGLDFLQAEGASDKKNKELKDIRDKIAKDVKVALSMNPKTLSSSYDVFIPEP